MSITYPLSWPSYVKPRSVTLSGNAVVGVATSPFTLSQQAQVWPGRRWTAKVAMPSMQGIYAAAFRAWFLSLNGRQGTFLFGDFASEEPLGTALGTPLVNGANQTGSSLITDGWTINQSNLFYAGDYLQLGSGSTSRLHVVLQNAASDASGNATLEIWPPLRESPLDNAAITVLNCQTQFRLSSNAMPMEISLPKIYGFTFDIEEAI